MIPRNDANILLFLAQGFEDLEAVAILDVCGWTEYRDHIPTVRVTTTGLHEKVHGRFGVVIKPELPFDDINAADYVALAIPGGFRSHGFDEAYDERVYSLIRAIHTQGGTIATMCVGILPVAESGLVRGKQATCYPYSRHDNLALLREFGAVVMDEPIIVDDRIISCAGPAQSVEVALLMIESIIGLEAALEVKRHMIYRERK